MQELLDLATDKISEQIKRIEITYLTTIIPKRLMNKFQKINCNTVNDILKIDYETFKSVDSVGPAVLKDFVELINQINSNPKVILETYESNKEISLPSLITTDFFTDFARLINDYFNLLKDENGLKAKDIIYKRFSLFGNSNYTLEELGLFYDITRERIRQIQNDHIKNLRYLLNGSPLKKPFCLIDPSFLESHNSIFKEIANIEFISESKIISYLESFKINISNNDDIWLLYFILKLQGFERYSYNDLNYFIINKKINQKTFELACNKVLDALQEHVIPISLFDLVINIRKDNKKIDKESISYAIEFLDEIESIKESEVEKFQIKFSKLKSIKDFAYRILYEKQEIMHYQEIWREIQHRLVAENEDKRDTDRSLKNQLVSDSRFRAIGRTGNWGLSDWEHDSSSIIELIIKAIHYYNKPSTIGEISKYVNEIRPQIKQHSIYSGLYPNIATAS